MNKLQTILHIDEAFHLIALIIFSIFSLGIFTLMDLHYEKYVLMTILSVYCLMDVVILLKSYFNKGGHFNYSRIFINNIYDRNYYTGKLNEIFFRFCTNMSIEISRIFLKVAFVFCITMGFSAGINVVFDVVENPLGNFAYLIFSVFLLTLCGRIYKDFLDFKKKYDSLNFDSEIKQYLLETYTIKDSKGVFFISGELPRRPVGVKYKNFIIINESFMSYKKKELDFRDFMNYLYINGKTLDDMNNQEMAVYFMINY